MDVPSGEALFEAVLSAHQLRAYISARPEFCASWDAPSPPFGQRGVLHLLREGACWVRSPALGEPVRLGAGDLIVLAHGDTHRFCSHVDAGEPCDFARFLCAEFEFVTGLRNPVVAALPRAFVVRAETAGDALARLGDLLASEASAGAFGNRVVLDKLCDALFVLALRAHIASNGDTRGLLAALGDRLLARALVAMHEDPARDWTVAELAECAAMSRTVFAERFHRVVGMAPIAYLTQWRMTEALRRLRDPRQSVASVAASLGYGTETAFRRGFKRVHGFSPGEARRSRLRTALGKAGQNLQRLSGL